MNRWKDCRYLIIDEVSMIDASVMVSLHGQLMKIKSEITENFSGINIIFVSNFLQLPSIKQLDLYILNSSKTEQCHSLWRSLNAVVILK